MSVDDCHREEWRSTACSKQGCAWSGLIDAAVHLTGAIEEDTDRPTFLKASCGCTNRLSITGPPFHGISAAGANNASQDWDPEEFGFGHKRHRTAQSVAKQWRIEMGTVIRDHNQWPLKRHQCVAARPPP